MLAYFIYDVFTTQPYSGNPLAVVPLDAAEQLNANQMQRIAAQFNLSETVFVLPPQDASSDARLRIFTPKAELPFAGHPTVGAALHVASTRTPQPRELAFEEGAGIVRVTLSASKLVHAASPRATLTAAQPLQVQSSGLSLGQGAALLSLAPEALVRAPFVASAGTPFLFLELVSAEALARAHFDHGAWRELGQDPIHGRAYAYARLGSEGQAAASADLRARLFAPSLGIVEDPATGSAAAALAGVMALTNGEDGEDGEDCWTLEQGIEMGRPSLLYLAAQRRGGEAHALRVGGHAALVGQGKICTPSPG